MLKALSKGTRKDDPTKEVTFIILGLSAENVRRLKAGQPVHVDGRQIEMPDVDVILFAGDTEASMTADLVRMGVDPNVVREHGA